MNKQLKVGVVLLLLLLFPLLSYIYLKKGFNYQLENLEEISVKAELNKSYLQSIGFPFDSTQNTVNPIFFAKGQEEFLSLIHI